VNPKPGAPGI